MTVDPKEVQAARERLEADLSTCVMDDDPIVGDAFSLRLNTMGPSTADDISTVLTALREAEEAGTAEIGRNLAYATQRIATLEIALREAEEQVKALEAWARTESWLSLVEEARKCADAAEARVAVLAAEVRAHRDVQDGIHYSLPPDGHHDFEDTERRRDAARAATDAAGALSPSEGE